MNAEAILPHNRPAYARAAALKRLVKNHPDEFRDLYRQEAERLGVKVKT